MVARARSERRRRAERRRRLARNDIEAPLETRHLTPRLASLAQAARTARLVLETPLLRFDDLWQDTPWRTRERLAEIDAALTEARLVLWQWLRLLTELDDTELATLRQLELDPRPLRSLLYRPGIFERESPIFDEGLFPVLPDVEQVTAVLFEAMQTLRSFEEALASMHPHPYR